MRLITGDTDIAKVGGGTHSGRGMRLASIVLWGASGVIIEKGRQVAALLLQASPDAVDFWEGRFAAKGTGASVSLLEVAAAMNQRTDLPPQLRGPLKGECDETVNVAGFPYGCHVCEVEIEPELGTLHIVKHTAVDDVGRAINPLIIHGQTHGGIAQGVGQALLEQCFYDAGTGQLLSGTFMDYAMPRADVLPFYTTDISEVPSTTHPLGIRPAGEGGTTPALGVSLMPSSTPWANLELNTLRFLRPLSGSGGPCVARRSALECYRMNLRMRLLAAERAHECSTGQK